MAIDIVMKIKRSEYLDLNSKVNTLTAENESLKKEVKTLKNKLTATETTEAENKKKGANK